MENYLNKLNNFKNEIKNSTEYIEILTLQKEIKNNHQLMQLINDIKKKQQNIIKNKQDEKELSLLNNKLYSDHLYQKYYQKLIKLNTELTAYQEIINDYIAFLLDDVN